MMKKHIKVINKAMHYFIGDKEVTAAEFTGSFVTRPLDVNADAVEHHTAGFTGYPIESLAMAVRSGQVAEAAAHDKKLGVPTEYTRSGRPIWRDASHRKKYLKAHGYFDRDAFC